jgi:uncharacterized protein YjbI with pentapeptide repeats
MRSSRRGDRKAEQSESGDDAWCVRRAARPMKIHCCTGVSIAIEAATLVGASMRGLDIHRAMLTNLDLASADRSDADLPSV